VRKISECNKKLSCKEHSGQKKEVIVIAERKSPQQLHLTWAVFAHLQYDEESKETAFNFSFEVSSAQTFPCWC